MQGVSTGALSPISVYGCNIVSVVSVGPRRVEPGAPPQRSPRGPDTHEEIGRPRMLRGLGLLEHNRLVARRQAQSSAHAHPHPQPLCSGAHPQPLRRTLTSLPHTSTPLTHEHTSTQSAPFW
jgi:hypothetical protein